MSEEIIQIESCPICQHSHSYRLDVERATIIKMLTKNDERERPRSVRVTRLFICPLKNEQFQGTFYLQDTSWDRIRNVSVVGPAEEKTSE